MSWWNPISWFGETKTEEIVKTTEPVVFAEGVDPLMGGDEALRAGLVRVREHVGAMVTALEALNETPPEPDSKLSAAENEQADLDWRKSVRNRVLAGGGEKALFFGTLSTEPVIAVRDLIDLGWEEGMANDIITERDKLRAAALTVSPLGTAPAPKE